MLDIVKHRGCTGHTVHMEAFVDDLVQVLLDDLVVNLQAEHIVQCLTLLQAKILGDNTIENQKTQRAVNQTAVLLAFIIPIQAHFDGGLQRDLAIEVSQFRFFLGSKHAALALGILINEGEVVAADNHVLRGGNDRLAVLGFHDVIGGQHQETRLGLRLNGEGNVDGHLVAVEVSVICRADEGMQLDRLALNEDRLKSLNAQAVQRGGAVEKNGVLPDDIFKNIPDLRLYLLHGALGGFNVVGDTQLDQPFHHKGLEQLKRHLLGQAALVQLEFRTDDDNRTS